MYEYLLLVEKLSPQQIIVAGHSSGGCLALSTLLRIRDLHSSGRQPLACLLLSPFVDLSVGPNGKNAPFCFLIDNALRSINMYHPATGDPSTWGDASPVHYNLAGLPPAYIQVGNLEYVLPHAQKLYAKAKADGLADWVLDVHQNVPHLFSVFPIALIRMLHEGLDAIAAFTATHFNTYLQTAQAA